MKLQAHKLLKVLRNSNRKVRHPNLTLAVVDHNIPTTDRSKGIDDADSRIQSRHLIKIVKNLVFNYLEFMIKDKE